MDFSVVDESITITDEESFSTCHALAQTQGILVGGSAGMNVCAAIKIAEAAPEGSVVVTILCDNGVKCVLPPACLPIRPGPAPTSPAHFNRFHPELFSVLNSFRAAGCSDTFPRCTTMSGSKVTNSPRWKTLPCWRSAAQSSNLTRYTIVESSTSTSQRTARIGIRTKHSASWSSR